MYRRNRSKARAWTNTTWSRVRKVGSKGILCQINMIQMFQGHPWHPGCNTAQYLVSSCRPRAAASSSQLQKLISQGWRPVNINRFYIQLQNVSSSVQKGPNVGLCSPKVSVHKLFNVGSCLSLQVQAEVVLVDVLGPHGVDDPAPHSQRPPVEHPQRGLLLQL